MKVVEIVKTNLKGQIVIPKKMREALSIAPETPLNLVARGGVIYLYPIEEVISPVERTGAYLKVLERTRGAWALEARTKTRNKRRSTEIIASKKRRQLW